VKAPSFSIIVPTFERREVVCDAVRAIARIGYPGSLELIVVVDGSTDGTAEALRTIECRFPTNIVVQENRGLAQARNRGAAEASGSILLFLDDDMICEPDIVRRHADSYAAGADAVLGHIPLDPASPPGVLAEGVREWAEARAATLSSGAPLTLFDLLGGHLSVRREVFDALGGFDQTFTAGGTYGNEDIDFGTRLIAAYTIVFNRQAVAWHRYVVSPRAHMRQYFEGGCADVDFARKHPELGQQLFELHGARSWRARLILRPLASLGWPVALARTGAIALAKRYDRLPSALRPPAKRLFFAARDLVYWFGVRSRGGIPRSRRLLILCYHAIADLSGDPVLADYGLPPVRFAKQLDALLARGFTFVSPDALAALIAGRARLPARAALLTFDDCYAELAEVARTILAPRGIPAIAFAVSGMASGTNEWDNSAGSLTLRLLDAAGLREIGVSGVEVGCHSRTHRPLPQLDHVDLEAETAGAMTDLAAMGVPTPRYFAYPFGLRDARAKAAVAHAGFAAGFGLRSGCATAGSDRFDLPRVEILARDTGWRFHLKTAWPRVAGAPGRFDRLMQLPARINARLAKGHRAPSTGV